MGHSDESTFADYFKYEQEIYRAIISAAVLCQWIAEHDTPPTDGEAEELAREIDRRLCEDVYKRQPLYRSKNLLAEKPLHLLRPYSRWKSLQEYLFLYTF